MCKAFSGLLLPDKKVFWKFGVDSHTELLELAKMKDDTADPHAMTFARFEITPRNSSYMKPDAWDLKIAQRITPSWMTPKHEEAAFASHKKWLRKLNAILIPAEIIHPFKIDPPKEITAKHIRLLKEWASVGDSIWDSVWDSVGDSGVGDSVRASVWVSIRSGIRGSVWVGIRDSIWASVGAYTGSFFRIPKWKYVKHAKGVYPFASCVQLWKMGLVPSFDGTTWRLHGGPKAKVLLSITAAELRSKAYHTRKGGHGSMGN